MRQIHLHQRLPLRFPVRALFGLLALGAGPTLASAQTAPVVEIGTSLGLTVVNANGGTLTTVGIPGAGFLGQPAIYLSFFAGKSVMVEPSVGFTLITGGGETETLVHLGGQVGYFFNGSFGNSPYIAANVSSVFGSSVDAARAGVGGKVGYRTVVGSSLGVRFEAGYRRWFSAHTNEITFGIGIGGIVHRTH